MRNTRIYKAKYKQVVLMGSLGIRFKIIGILPWIARCTEILA